MPDDAPQDDPNGQDIDPAAGSEPLRLDVLLEREGPIQAERAAAIVAALAERAAAEGVPPRELSLDRVSLGPGDAITILEGPAAAAPNVAPGADADVHVLGVLLFQLVTGRPPEFLSTLLDLPSRDELRRLPDEVATAIRHSIMVPPAQRFASPEEMAAALQGRSIEPEPPPAPTTPAPLLFANGPSVTMAPSAPPDAEPAPPSAGPLPPPRPSTFDPEQARAKRPLFMGGQGQPTSAGTPPPGPPFVPPPAGGGRPPGPPLIAPPPEPPWPYPMRFSVAYPGQLSRLTTFFRAVILFPVLIFAYPIGTLVQGALIAGWMAVFVRKTYPAGLFTGLQWAMAWQARAHAYALLLTDDFPRLDPAGSPVQLEFRRPEPGGLSRWRVLFWKLMLLLPQFIVLFVVGLAVAVVVVIAWFAILFTGRYPRGIFGFVEGYLRWTYRVSGYLASFYDDYPPYSLAANAPPASNGAVVANGIIGAVLGPGLGAMFIVGYIALQRPTVVDVDYAALQTGEVQYVVEVEELVLDVGVTLAGAADPSTDLPFAPEATAGNRIVAFSWTIDVDEGLFDLGTDSLRLHYEAGPRDGSVAPLDVLLDDRRGDLSIDGSGDGELVAFFEVPEAAELTSLAFEPEWDVPRRLRYDFGD